VRRLLLAILLTGYAATFFGLPSLESQARVFDPLEPRGREVESAIELQRYADALLIARQLASLYPDDPTIAFWLAEIFKGLGEPAEEAGSWERVFELTGSSDAVCPSLPMAYARLGDRVKALDAYTRCAARAEDDPERWVDLASAYVAEGRGADADRAFARSRALDASNPRLPRTSAVAPSTEPPQ
jgi:Flp pilus assembly protein TadD